jgi:ABC-type Na+ transport system ATPase subunit NatA
MIEVRGLTKRFGPVTAVDGLGFTVRPGRVTGFLGPNGAAKAATAGAVALAAGEGLAFASFFLTQAILSGHHRGLSLTHPGVPGAVLAITRRDA